MIAYIHIPKTGGTYVRRACPHVEHLGHTVIDDAGLGSALDWSNNGARPLPADAKVFATIRNPYSLLVSYYRMMIREAHGRPDAPSLVIGYASIDFAEFVHAVAAHESRKDARFGKSFMFCQLFKTSGTLAVDYIARQKTLDVALSILSEAWSFAYRKRHRFNVGKDGPRQREWYDDALAAFVRQHWPRELKMFGYSRDAQHVTLLGRTVTDEDRAVWRYDFLTDTLTYKGKVL